MAELKVEDGHFQYSPDKKILDGINYSVKSGELVAILGPNGVGKTTLLKCTMGLNRWSYGRSMLNGNEISQMRPEELFGKVAYVPQAKADIPNYLTEEMVLLGRGAKLGFFSQPKKEDYEVVDNAMERLGITFLKGKKCREISGGELQMVLIARALASEPEAIVLDEPESNLDFRNQIMVMETLKKLKEDNVACLFNTHYPAHALQYASKALLLERSGKASFGPVEEIINEGNIERAFRVKAVIGELESEGKLIRDIIPISLSEAKEKDEEKRVVAAVTIALRDPDAIKTEFEHILEKYKEGFIGRMGIPYRKRSVNIVIITIDAEERTIRGFLSELNALYSVSAKATITESN